MSTYCNLKMETIKGYQFDLNSKVYLTHPKRKFWELTIKGTEIHYRAGVLRFGEQHKIKEVNKDYESDSVAKATAIIKIAGKIEKGYTSATANRLPSFQQNTISKTIRRKTRTDKEKQDETADEKQTKTRARNTRSKGKQKGNSTLPTRDANKKLWKGLSKGDEVLQMNVIGNQLKIMRRCGAEQSNQIKNFQSYNEAVDYVHGEEDWYTKEGFKPLPSSTFMEQQSKTVRKSDKTGVPNPLSGDRSLTTLTDNAMWHNSGIDTEDNEENVYKPNPFLGPPIDECIKCLLAQNYRQQTDPTDWIMSQKLDGVRCLWTGTEMYSRNANKFNFPNFFTKNWPKCQLDGELFIGRGKFSQTLSAVKKNIPVASEWENLKYLVFDAPGLKEPFKKRIKLLEQQLNKIDNPFIKCHAHRPCLGFPDLFSELEKVNKAGGEGIMLRQPEALYQNKRSKNLQKVKTFYDDQAQIIGYIAGTGRCTGWVGSLRVRNGKGIQFEVGSGLNDQLRQNPPAIGSKITYKYQEFNKQSGKPRFPTFLRTFTAI